jgi:hypothetical protein
MARLMEGNMVAFFLVKLGAHETLDYSVLLFCQLGPKIKM